MRLSLLNTNSLFKRKKLADDVMPDKYGNVWGYLSRTKLGLCKNKGCGNARREGSAYCGRKSCGINDKNEYDNN